MEQSKIILAEAINSINAYSLVTYMEILGHTPLFSNQDIAIFHSPFTDCLDATLIIDKKRNRFHINYSVQNGSVFDLARLAFQASPADILADIVPYRLDQLISAEPKAWESIPD